jgi:hypothetical protein
MYISHQSQQAVHQDIVSDGLRRSELRRMLKARREQDNHRVAQRTPTVSLRGLVSVLLGGVARP